MGLDTTHDAWSGAYGAFHRWRCKVAEVAGLPPLDLMEGFYNPLEKSRQWTTLPTLYHGPHLNEDSERPYLATIDERLPIKWDALKPSALHELLIHSDCDGEISAESCTAIADELETLVPLMPEGDAGGHIGNWRAKTQQFIKGLRAAAAAGEPLGFH